MTAFTLGQVQDLTFLLNRDGWVFDDAEHRYTMALSSLTKTRPNESAVIPMHGPYSDEGRYSKGMMKAPLQLQVAEVLEWTDTAALPLLPREDSGETFLQLRRAQNFDADEGHSWRARPHRELDATNDKKLMKFAVEQPEGFWPVFGGESFDIWEPDRGNYYAWANQETMVQALLKKRLRSSKLTRSAFNEFPMEWIRDLRTLPCWKARIAFRDVARATDTRTVPDAKLDALLDLETRIRRKLAQAAASVGVENEVIPGTAISDIVFSETREEIERLRREDPTIFENAGEDPAAHSGEEYRQELRKGLEVYGDKIASLPWGAGSGFVGGAERGHFFCARVGKRLFMRFVPWEEKPIIRDTLGCLRLISCREDTPRSLSDELYKRAFSSWQKARRDVFDEWSFATDPANLQPRISPGLRVAAEHVRKYPPPDIVQENLDKLVEAIEAPWGPRIVRQIRQAMDTVDGVRTSQEIAATVRRLGLEPFQAPTPLPPIQVEDIRLICWLAVDSSSLG